MGKIEKDIVDTLTSDEENLNEQKYQAKPKPKQKREYVMTPARKAAIERMRAAKEKKNAEINAKKDADKKILETAKAQQQTQAQPKPKRKTRKNVIVIEDESSSSEEENKIVIRRKNKKHKKKKKRLPSPEPSSSETEYNDTETEEEEEYVNQEDVAPPRLRRL